MSTTLYDELCELTKLEATAGVDESAMAWKFFKVLRRLEEDEWREMLSNEAQDWYNAMAVAKNNEAVAIPGFPEEELALAPEDEKAENEEEEAEEESLEEAVEEEAVEEVSSVKQGAKTKMSRSAVKRAAKGNGKRRVRAEAAEAKPRRGRRGRYDLDAKITLVGDNPRREGSKVAALHDKLRSGMTVQEALDAGLRFSNLAREVEMKAIKIG